MPLERGIPSPSKPPLPSENFPTRPRRFPGENLFRFSERRGLAGKFFPVGRCFGIEKAALRSAAFSFHGLPPTDMIRVCHPLI